ncbi:polysaccharide deacetylase family protein [Actinospica durhamensis]|uniref:polysaccharide deacetylase family protein n=1 Tax=Actinospica durhamensis TaxID=1508375 RepID=UPI0027DD2C14|nr:polysaccharide deacetylase family protein [Actinospica durhamensis]
MSRLATLAKYTAGLAAVGAVAHAAPSVTSLGPVRATLWPRLTGIGDPGHVALTFDDGPDPASTPLFLAALDEAGVKATFFLLGTMVQKAPWLAREIADAGHEVALHGWAHRAHVAVPPAQTFRDLREGRDEVASAIGQAPQWYRPPYGVATAATFSACRKLGLRPVLWSAWGRDWTAKATPESVFQTVARDLRGGGTVLLHDSDCTSKPASWRSTLGALPLLLAHCAEQGWRVGPLGEHGLTQGGATRASLVDAQA